MAKVERIKSCPKMDENSLESKIEMNKFLEQYYQQVRELAQSQIAHGNVITKETSEEVDDLVQTSLITFWLRLLSSKEQIVSPKAYISCVVRSRFIDIMRQQKRKRTLPLPLNQEGELYQGKAILIPGDGMLDPAREFERKEWIAEVIDDVLELPSHQQRAMLCMLKDEVGDTSLLAEEFEKHGIDIKTINWPKEASELQSLKSSLSIARKKLRSMSSKNAFV